MESGLRSGDEARGHGGKAPSAPADGAAVARATGWLERALGAHPFPWQVELLKRLLDDRIPSAVDVPTGLGKTAVMAVWLVARAAGAPVPRRLVYVVDRRAVVDQATEVALGLRKLVDDDEVLRSALGLVGALPISTLRGQFVDNREWLEDPASPAIVLGTVDMVGSRLLFEGYGVSRKMRPYHAGLLGVDALVVLDEAHLVPGFQSLVERIAEGQRRAPGARDALGIGDASLDGLVPSFRVLPLSATGREAPGAIRLGEADFTDTLVGEVVRRRVHASKWLRITDEVEPSALVDRIAAEAWATSSGGTVPVRCLVYCDRREDARKVVEALWALAGDAKRAHGAIETELIVGERRVFERSEAARRLRSLGLLAGSHVPREKPTFVVATSAGEVGIDLDADHMVCDVVPWERMVQRLGRVNRRGDGDATILVVPAAADKKTTDALDAVAKAGAATKVGSDEAGTEAATDDDAPADEGAVEDEGEGKGPKREVVAIAARRRRLEQTLRALRSLPAAREGHDASPAALLGVRQLAREDASVRNLLDAASTPAPLAPALTRPLLEAWSMTSLDEHTGRPEVEPWLRGWVDDEDPQTTVVWRAELPVARTPGGGETLMPPAELEAFLDAAPPHTLERLEAPFHRVFEWLGKRSKKARDERPGGPESEDVADRVEPQVGRLRTHDVAAVVLRPGRSAVALRAEDVTGASKRELDDLKRALMGSTVLVDVRMGGLGPDGLLDDNAQTASDVGDASIEGRAALPFRVSTRTSNGTGDGGPGAWREEARLVRARNGDGEPIAWVVLESQRDEQAESEEGRSAGATRAQALDEHEAWTEAHAHALATRLGLPAPYVATIALAARLHDEGKRARRWQRAFGAPATGGPYAKTVSRPKLELLEGYRHELGSLPVAEADPRVRALPPDLADLCLHLIASHHGFARPLLRTDGCDAPPSLLVARAQAIALRFTRVERRFGPWGLAWLEAVLRAADQQASRQNDEGGRHG